MRRVSPHWAGAWYGPEVLDARRLAASEAREGIVRCPGTMANLARELGKQIESGI